MRGYKIPIFNEKESTKLQLQVFALGGSWFTHGTQVSNLDAKYIYLQRERLPAVFKISGGKNDKEFVDSGLCLTTVDLFIGDTEASLDTGKQGKLLKIIDEQIDAMRKIKKEIVNGLR